MKEAILFQKLTDKKVRCLACQRKCIIADSAVGFCLARKNVGGKLYPLLYGYTTGIQIDPIEKKPFYHFKPGSQVATIGSWGCNFRCKQCLNSYCTWGPTATEALRNLSLTPHPHNTTHNPQLIPISPNQIIQEIIDAGYCGIAFSYNEPVIWAEFAADIAREFKLQWGKKPLITNYLITQLLPSAVFVTNGSWTKETIDLLTKPVDRYHTCPLQSATGDAKRWGRMTGTNSPTARNEESTGGGAASGRTRCQLIDAANIDFKGFSEETYRKMGAFFGTIPAMAAYAQKKGIFLELTTLLIPGINDDPDELKKMTVWIAENLGPDTPWHLSQFDPLLAPDKDFQKIPFTPIEDLEKAAAIGQKQGLNHIYIYAPSANYSRSDTLCPKCKKVVIHRNGWQVLEMNITPKGKCAFCHYQLNVVL